MLKRVSCSESGMVENILASSANNEICVPSMHMLTMSFRYIKNKSGPITDPCGTQLTTFSDSDVLPLIAPFCERPTRNVFIQASSLPFIQYELSTSSSLLCDTLSNALDKSVYTTLVIRLLS